MFRRPSIGWNKSMSRSYKLVKICMKTIAQHNYIQFHSRRKKSVKFIGVNASLGRLRYLKFLREKATNLSAYNNQCTFNAVFEQCSTSEA